MRAALAIVAAVAQLNTAAGAPLRGHMERAARISSEDDAKFGLDKLDTLLAASSTTRDDAALLAEIG